MAWAIQAPAWASPPFWLAEESYRLRSEAIEAWVRRYETNPLLETRTWQRLYREGWRVVRVTVVLGSPLTLDEARRPQAQAFRRQNQILLQQAIDNYEAAEEGSAAKSYAGGQVRAHRQIDMILLRAT